MDSAVVVLLYLYCVWTVEYWANAHFVQIPMFTHIYYVQRRMNNFSVKFIYMTRVFCDLSRMLSICSSTLNTLQVFIRSLEVYCDHTNSISHYKAYYFFKYDRGKYEERTNRRFIMLYAYWPLFCSQLISVRKILHLAQKKNIIFTSETWFFDFSQIDVHHGIIISDAAPATPYPSHAHERSHDTPDGIDRSSERFGTRCGF